MRSLKPLYKEALTDAFTVVISKAANLIDPVKKIAAAILSIWQA